MASHSRATVDGSGGGLTGMGHPVAGYARVKMLSEVVTNFVFYIGGKVP
jgi:hypothetical protein